MVYDKELKLAGSIDMVFIDKNNDLHIKKLNSLNTNDKINNGLVSSLEKSIDNLIFDDIVEKDIRMIYAKKYQNNIREFNNVLLGVNRYLLEFGTGLKLSIQPQHCAQAAMLLLFITEDALLISHCLYW